MINYPVEPSMHDEAVIDSPESEEHPARPLRRTTPSRNCPAPTSPGHRTSQRIWPIEPTKHMSSRSSRWSTPDTPRRAEERQAEAGVRAELGRDHVRRTQASELVRDRVRSQPGGSDQSIQSLHEPG